MRNLYRLLFTSEDRIFAPICTCKNNWRIWRHNASTSRSRDVTDQQWGRHNAKSENNFLGDNGEMSDRWLFSAELCTHVTEWNHILHSPWLFRILCVAVSLRILFIAWISIVTLPLVNISSNMISIIHRLTTYLSHSNTYRCCFGLVSTAILKLRCFLVYHDSLKGIMSCHILWNGTGHFLLTNTIMDVRKKAM